MPAPARSRRSKSQRRDELIHRLGALTAGLTVARVLRADEHELVIEFADGTRLFVRTDAGLEISVT